MAKGYAFASPLGSVENRTCTTLVFLISFFSVDAKCVLSSNVCCFTSFELFVGDVPPFIAAVTSGMITALGAKLIHHLARQRYPYRIRSLNVFPHLAARATFSDTLKRSAVCGD